MLTFRTILHPTDFSEPSQAAFGVAAALARDHGARLLLLHVAEPPVIMYGEGVIPPEPVAIQDQLRAQLERLQPPDPVVPVERQLVEGDPADAILDRAEQTHCDLIVLGTHGRTGLGRLLMGSVAEQVVRKARCPVLTVKTPLPSAAPASAKTTALEANVVPAAGS